MGRPAEIRRGREPRFPRDGNRQAPGSRLAAGAFSGFFPGRLLAAWFCILAAAAPLHAGARTQERQEQQVKRTAASALPPAVHSEGCRTYVDSVARAFDRDEPGFLDWDMPLEKCDRAQTYRLYYFRGLGSFFESDWEDALLYLSMAKEVGGPEDEQVLYYLYRTYGKFGETADQTWVIWELHNRFPQSPHLRDMFREWKSSSRPGGPWSFTAVNSMSHSVSPGDNTNRIRDNYRIRNNVSAAVSQKAGGHHFRESVGLTANTDGAGHILDQWSGYLAGSYRHKRMSLDLSWGASYDRPLRISASTSTSTPPDIGLAMDQYQAALGYSWGLGNVSSTELRLEAIHPRRDWTIAILSQNVTALAGDFFLLGAWSAERHWMDFYPSGPGLPDFQGLYVANLGATAYYDRGPHGFSLGSEYGWEREIITGLDPVFDSPANVKRTVAAGLGYAFRLAPWAKVELEGKAGWEINDLDRDDDGMILHVGLSFQLNG